MTMKLFYIIFCLLCLNLSSTLSTPIMPDSYSSHIEILTAGIPLYRGVFYVDLFQDKIRIDYEDSGGNVALYDYLSALQFYYNPESRYCQVDTLDQADGADWWFWMSKAYFTGTTFVDGRACDMWEYVNENVHRYGCINSTDNSPVLLSSVVDDLEVAVLYSDTSVDPQPYSIFKVPLYCSLKKEKGEDRPQIDSYSLNKVLSRFM
eukprot:TRINITY_DN6831_c0_g1_i1.p1 TRINITY_DN6831_c0_g1~~TRINITY_DN6831_c0_g1_i1.p1  ORF type:complete len:206 (-),score=32.10 TRINITY_DN6831_c0_g1_i1:368-985(-)